MEKQNDDAKEWRQNFNITYTLCLWHQRSVVIPLRTGVGPDALGFPCFCAFVLMVLWATFTCDPFLWGWLAFWSLCFVLRRIETVWLYASGARLHGWFDGRSLGTTIFGLGDGLMKLVVEPLLIGGLGWAAYKWYESYQFPPHGLPYFLMAGAFTLPFVEIVKRTIWTRRRQATLDARLESQATVESFRRHYGDF